MSSKDKGNVKVLCRFRPFNQLEKTYGNEEVAVFTSETSLTFNSTKENNKYKYNFDRIFQPNSTQQEIFEYGVKDIIDSVLEGYNGTVLAYGQTSSGKTYTMQGIVESEENRGIIPRMINYVFNYIYNSPPEIEFTVKTSMVEIYQEKIRDLIDLKKFDLKIHEDPKRGIYIGDVSEHYCSTADEVLAVMNAGNDNRAVACTNMNEHSSRSHSIFVLTINMNNKNDKVSKTGKLYLVDLAGSEKISKTGATGTTLEEAKKINLSLTTLGKVIYSLTDGKSKYIPYRDSKLTRVLQESLGGNSKTCLIITCSPSIYNESETLSTLRFGERAKKMKNKPKINKEVTVEELLKVIEKLEDKLKRAKNRINQLEKYIQSNNLQVPPDTSGLQSEEKKSDQKNEENGIKKNNTLKDIDEKKLLEQYREQMEQQGVSLTEKISSTINNLKETEEGYEDLVDIVGQLLVIKDEAIKNEEENKKEIEQLKNDLELMTQNKNKLQDELLKNLNQLNDDKSNPFSNNKNYDFNIIKNNTIEFINKLKNDKNINSNKNTLQIVNDFQNKFNSFNNNNNNNNLDLFKSTLNNPNRITIKNIEEKFLNNKLTTTEQDTQTDDDKLEIEKVKFEAENSKKIFLKKLGEKNEEVLKYESDLNDLQEKYNILKSNIALDNKKSIEKLLLYESNIKELKNKLMITIAEKSNFEDQNEKLLKMIKEKMIIIAKYEADKEKENNKNYDFLRGSLNPNMNIRKIIQGRGSILS